MVYQIFVLQITTNLAGNLVTWLRCCGAREPSWPDCMMAMQCRCGKTHHFHHAASAKPADNRLPPQMTNLAGSGSKRHSFLSSKNIADKEALATEAKRRHLGTKTHWALALIGRHPAYTELHVVGRVILPFIEKARKTLMLLGRKQASHIRDV